MTNPAAMLVFVLTALTLGPTEGFLRPGILSPGRAAQLTWCSVPHGPWSTPKPLQACGSEDTAAEVSPPHLEKARRKPDREAVCCLTQ